MEGIFGPSNKWKVIFDFSLTPVTLKLEGLAGSVLIHVFICFEWGWSELSSWAWKPKQWAKKIYQNIILYGLSLCATQCSFKYLESIA